MTAAQDQPLADRILAAIAKVDSAHPANAEAVRRELGAESAEFWDRIELLQERRHINSCLVRRSGEASWLAIWPTGTCLKVGGWKNADHSVLFAGPKLPRRFPAAPDPHADPRPDLGRGKPDPEIPMEKTDCQIAAEPSAASAADPKPDTAPAKRANSTPRVTDRWASYPRQADPERTVEFALWSDGHLDIVDGDEIFRIPPGAVKRLALLLGVPAEMQS